MTELVIIFRPELIESSIVHNEPTGQAANEICVLM